jgi:hypothetical protein
MVLLAAAQFYLFCTICKPQIITDTITGNFACCLSLITVTIEFYIF